MSCPAEFYFEEQFSDRNLGGSSTDWREEGHLAARVDCGPHSKRLITASGGSWVPQTYLSVLLL